MATNKITVSFGEKYDQNLDLEHEKLTDWENEPSVMDLNQDLMAAKPYHDSMCSKIKEWMDILKVEGSAAPRVFGKNRSKAQPKLVRKQGEWRYSSLTESFLSSEKFFKVAPRTWEDELGSRQNQTILNYQMDTKIEKVPFIDEFVRTCYDEGVVFIKTGWFRKSYKEKVEKPVYQYLSLESPEEQQVFQQLVELKSTNRLEYERTAPEQAKAAISYFEETQQPNKAIPTGEVELVEEEIIDENNPTLDILDYNNVYLDPSCNGRIGKARFAIFSFETSKAELKEDGRYINLDKVNWTNNSPLNTTEHTSNTPNDFNFKDEARKRVVAYEYWGFYDVNNDGVLVPIVATWIGNVMIRMEENPFPDRKIPLVAVPYMPIRKSAYGEADAELLRDNQNVLGAISRGLIDSMGRTANGQRGFAKNMLDLTNRRKFENGEDYEFNPGTDPRQGIYEHKFGEISQSALAIMEMQNQEAESLTGVKAFTGGMSGEAYGKVAAGIRGMLDASSKREMGILRRLAFGISEIGKKMIAMNAVFLSEEEVIRVTNEEFVFIRREDLKGNYDLIVDISTPEVDEAKANDLNFMLQTNGNNMDTGMRNMIIAEIADLKRMPTLAHKIRNYQPQPDPLAVQIQQLEIQKLSLENAKLQEELNEIRTKAMLNAAKAREADSSADQKDLDYVEQETGTKHARELDKASQQARALQNLKVTDALLKPRKAEERAGNFEAAIGFNQMTNSMDDPLNR